MITSPRVVRAEREPGRSFALSSYLFGRVLGLVFLIAFVSFHVQLRGLVGDHGITPARELFEAFRANQLGFWDVPTLAWLASDAELGLVVICFLGELVSLALIAGAFSGPMSLLASILYLSIVNAGGPFMAFQWDSLLVESGFAASMLLSWMPFERPSRTVDPSPVGRWVVYLLLLKLMFLSGAVKLGSGDEAWRDLSALEYHYSTQPLPTPFAWLAHQMPSWFHAISTFLVFVGELAVPWTMLGGRVGKRTAFGGIAGLMLIIALTGNYGFFNLLTFALCLPLLDDHAVSVLSSKTTKLARATEELPNWRIYTRWIALPFALAMVVLGTMRCVLTLGGGRALPDSALDALEVTARFRAVNGYGLFAIMTTVRHEIRIEGSLDGEHWREYRFAHKPDDPGSMPGFNAPHMPRLDWQMWFAALGGWRDSPWLFRFMQRLLEAQPEVLGLLADDPFDGARPRYVRAMLYDYELGDTTLLLEEGKWWRVEPLGQFGPTLGR